MKPPSSVQTSEFDSSDEEPLEDEHTPIQISWLSLSRVNWSQFLGLCALPEELKSCGIQDIFVFCTRGELSKYRVPNLLELYEQCGIATHHHPIPDGGTPDIARCCEIMEELAACLKNNRKTLIHCYGGLGRSCLGKKCIFIIFFNLKVGKLLFLSHMFTVDWNKMLRLRRLFKALHTLCSRRKPGWEWENPIYILEVTLLFQMFSQRRNHDTDSNF
uniref:protein-tyrosine-phosphatase n=1 Tax=Oryctolagus cuniculus TaxID=9986 RepID=A0A5F9CMQ4_RABIT